MASPLSPIQTLKRASDRLIVSIEDVSDLWPVVREGFELRLPFRRAILNNKARNPVLIEELLVEYILTTDARLCGRTSLEQSPFWFRHPYANVILVTCEDLDQYKSLLRPRLKQIVQNEDHEWFIVFVSKSPATEAAAKIMKKAYYRLETDFSSKNRKRCCRLETHIVDATAWEYIGNKVLECIRNTLDKRFHFYEEEVRRHLENRFMPAWNFSKLFVLKESLAIMFEMLDLLEDALREYDEVEKIYLEIVNSPHLKGQEFGGLDPGDEMAAILDASRKPSTQFLLEDSVREFDFRQYLFARQALLLFRLNRPAEVAARSFPFIITFSRSLLQHERRLPFCLHEIWVLTGCLAVVKATAGRFNPRSVAPDLEKDFYRLQADLYSCARTKLMRLADLIGYGSIIEKSPCNSAALSMLPWPNPAIWPPVPVDAATQILAKQQVESDNPEITGSIPKELPLAPSLLLREANRRRTSLSSGNLSELPESNNSLKGSFERSDSILGKEGVLGGGREGSKVVTSNSTTGDGAILVGSPQVVPSSPGSGSSVPHGQPGSPSRATLTPSVSWDTIDNPMKLEEIHAAAKNALLAKHIDESLLKALSSIEGFEELYLDLTRAAADNFHRTCRKRHGVVLDGEVAAVFHRRGNLDSAAKIYEKVCALYAGERWHALLAEVLHRLSDCQEQLGDWAGYLSSCITLLSLDSGLLSHDERKTLQSEIVRLAHSGLKSPVSLDVSALIYFTAKEGPPLALVEGDSGTLEVTVWSGFPEEISLESLSLTLMATFGADEGAKVVKSASAPVLSLGKNIVSILLPPQRPGSYVLGVLTGYIGDVKLRSHTYCYTSSASCEGGLPDSDAYLSFEKPLRPVLEVSKPRPLVDLKAVVSWRLLFGEPQWIGVVIKPLDLSLKGARVTISAGPNLELDLFQTTELEVFNFGDNSMPRSSSAEHMITPEDETITKEKIKTTDKSDNLPVNILPSQGMEVVKIKDGQVELPEWASNVSSILWLRVTAHAHGNHENTGAKRLSLPLQPALPKSLKSLARKTVSIGKRVKDVVTVDSISESPESGSPRQDLSVSTAEGIRTLNIKLEFGEEISRVFERAIAMQYTKPFSTAIHFSKGNDGTHLWQVTLVSELVATITILDARLVLQAGFVHVDESGGQPRPSLLPLVLSATSKGALLFVVRSDTATPKEGNSPQSNGPVLETSLAEVESRLIVHYKISGNRRIGAHAPVREDSAGHQFSEEDPVKLSFTSTFALQMPGLEDVGIPSPGQQDASQRKVSIEEKAALRRARRNQSERRRRAALCATKDAVSPTLPMPSNPTDLREWKKVLRGQAQKRRRLIRAEEEQVRIEKRRQYQREYYTKEATRRSDE